LALSKAQVWVERRARLSRHFAGIRDWRGL